MSSTSSEDSTGLRRFGVRALLGWAGLLISGVPFLLLWLLVQENWPPLAAIDGGVAASLNRAVSDSPFAVDALQVVTDLGGTGTAVLVFTLSTVFLLIRHRRRLAAFMALTGLGLAVLSPVTKAIVDRARPVVDFPVVEAPSNASFPSGHSMTAVVTWGALLLLVLPSVRRRARAWLLAAAVLLVLAVGFTRLALGVHYVSDVLAGWALGLGWLAVTTAAFRAWQHDLGRRPHEFLDPLDLPPEEAAHATSPWSVDRPVTRRSVARLAGDAGLLLAATIGLGLLVTAVLTDSWVGDLDRSVVRFVVLMRDPTWTTVAEVVGALSGARTVIAVGATAAVLAVAVTAQWRPAVFVTITLVGEVLLYVVSSRVVDRLRPTVADLTSGVPSAASWPSGHVAAAVTLYGAITVLVLRYGRRGSRALFAVPVLIALAVGLSRIYVAAHYPTDVLAGLALGGAWLLVCARVVLPPRPDRTVPGAGAPAGRSDR